MRLLVVQPRLIIPPDDGAKLYSSNLWRQIAQRHDLTMLVPLSSSNSQTDVDKLSNLCSSYLTVPWQEMPASGLKFYWALFKGLFSSLPYTISKYRSTAVQAQLQALLQKNQYDAIVADRLPTMINLPDRSPYPIVLINHNVEALVFKRFAAQEKRWLARWYLKLQSRRLQRFEQTSCQRAKLCIALSPVDLDLLKQYSKVNSAVVVPPGVDLQYFKPINKKCKKHNIVFSGSMDSLQNIHAAKWFANEVLPLIFREFPDTRFTIVGRNPDARLRELQVKCPGISVVGPVEDVRPFIAEAEVVVVPLRFGSGVRLKIYEALAMKKAVVSTSLGAEGTPFQHGKHLLLADTAVEMAASIEKLFKEGEHREQIEQTGYEYVYRHCGWERCARQLETALQGLVG